MSNAKVNIAMAVSNSHLTLISKETNEREQDVVKGHFQNMWFTVNSISFMSALI